MVKKQTLTVQVQSQKTHRWNTIDLVINGDINPTTIFDAINGLKSMRDNPKINSYDRLKFYWQDHEINLTNPGKTGADPQPYFGKDTEGYKWTAQFLSAYYREIPQPPEEEKKKDDSWKDELLPGLGITKGSVRFDSLPRTVPVFNDSPHTRMDHRDSRTPWQARWDDMMDESRAIEAANRERLKRHYDAYKPVFSQLEDLTSGKTNVTQIPMAIFHLLQLFVKAVIHLITSIPEEIQSAGRQFINNITFVGLSIERLWTVITGIADYVGKTYDIMSKIDWEGATKLLNMLIAEQKKALDFGIENKIFSDDGLAAGPENWLVPTASAPNDAETLKYWQAVQVLADSPFLGATVRAQLRFALLQHYQEQTGIGVPNTDAWIKYVLDQQIGTSAPIQDAMEMAGQVPDWFLGKTKDMMRVAQQTHQAEHKEIKQLKK